MGVDVVDVLGLQAGVGQGLAQGTELAFGVDARGVRVRVAAGRSAPLPRCDSPNPSRESETLDSRRRSPDSAVRFWLRSQRLNAPVAALGRRVL